MRFANIEEDTPSYHRRYDFFISKFSSMCHGTHENVEIRDSIRVAGIRGLQGVIRKTVSDDLVENIWDKHHMEKIVPSLLFNMKDMVSCQSLFQSIQRKNIKITFVSVINTNYIDRRVIRIVTTRIG